ncbi:MAG: hypothetical protein M3198_08110 [Actinomycetota bacterium]|nr:hypothetical protein [Actinomycetota bacterium]
MTPATVRLFVTPEGEIKWEDPMSSQIFDCGKATVQNTDLVEVFDYNTSADHLLIIDKSRAFGPGTTPESSGASEIEFLIDGEEGDNTLQVWGGDRRDTIVFGETGIALNRDGDADISQADYDDFMFLGKRRADFLSGGGGFGTGGPTAAPVTIYGNSGNDDLVGSLGIDRLLGSRGADTMSGGRSGDIIFGNEGADLLLGRAGGDELDGMGGADRLRGHAGTDDLEGAREPTIASVVAETITSQHVRRAGAARPPAACRWAECRPHGESAL